MGSVSRIRRRKIFNRKYKKNLP
ncbi:MAG: AURKAIP1/COX24 domain-containing protein [Chitinophagaceae bacterium]|nr:AURKAIP1/COX24 domain-containing protein [Chitinophagaceae bacterium]